jgi:hypothetical protein
MIRTERNNTGYHTVLGHSRDERVYIVKAGARWYSNAAPYPNEGYRSFWDCRRAVLDHLNGAA